MTDIAEIGAAVARQLRRKGYQPPTRNKEDRMTTRGPTAEERLLNVATNAAIQLARLKVRRYAPESAAAVAIEEAWVVVREAFVAQVAPAERSGLRLDLDELFENTKLHAATRTRVTDREAIRKA